MARSKARDEAIATISAVLGDDALTEDDKKEASAKAMSITDAIEAESRIENLIKAKGFADCMVYITEQSASVVVKSDGLTQDQATQIKNIVVSEGSIKGRKYFDHRNKIEVVSGPFYGIISIREFALMLIILAEIRRKRA